MLRIKKKSLMCHTQTLAGTFVPPLPARVDFIKPRVQGTNYDRSMSGFQNSCSISTTELRPNLPEPRTRSFVQLLCSIPVRSALFYWHKSCLYIVDKIHTWPGEVLEKPKLKLVFGLSASQQT
jgi:hypothetical protein